MREASLSSITLQANQDANPYPLSTPNAEPAQNQAKYLSIEALPASGSKCARCWNYMPEVSDYGIWQNVCTRCQSALKEMGIAPPHHPTDEDPSAGPPPQPEAVK